MAFGRHPGRLSSPQAVILVAVVLGVGALPAGFATSWGLPRDVTGLWSEVHATSPAYRGDMGETAVVSEDGDRMVLGAIVGGGPGVVAVFERTPDDGWNQTAVLTNPNPHSDVRDTFGWSLDLKGDTLAIAATGAENSTGNHQGAVYLYQHEAGTWNHTDTFRPPRESLGFGRGLDLTGHKLFVGASTEDPDGRVYVYNRTPDGWTLNATYTPPPDQGYHIYGESITATPKHVYVGDPDDLTVYAYNRTPTGLALADQLEAPPDYQRTSPRGAEFGWTTAAEDATVLVGAPGQGPSQESTGPVQHPPLHGEQNTGAAYAFERTNGSWDRVATLRAPNPDAQEYMGRSVTLDDGMAAVGSSGDVRREDAGGVYVYDTDDWSREAVIGPPEADGFLVGFATHVALRGDRLMATQAYGSTTVDAWWFGPDADDDRLGDRYETQVVGSQPGDRDTDGDQFADYTELFGAYEQGIEVLEGPADPTNPTSVPVPPPFDGVTVTEDPPRDEAPVADEHGPLVR